ncbi:hypothetical protein [Mycobacterium heckeshornense]|uniref:Uncharacterized protein n=1 Tax=Mycobacterium heckeshornense TaxID=110505 RepID=A0A7R7TTW5_9MYCO|nr:hypothetical protein [Mycobacterium heckeshornense]MCV7035717.1 hypothetical protein [Mycobacterium heckeshornense]BCO34946.1 hypothetical protein MHEC_13790 [Mycobacterium heckeshornense]BCQ08111.1 hypothetical protein JMUB5695_01536 [Mycobacterium heckeshornense]
MAAHWKYPVEPLRLIDENRGIRVGRKGVGRIMRQNGRKGAYLCRGWKHGST